MIEILESGNIRVKIGRRTVTVAVRRGDEESGPNTLVVELDGIESWDDGDPLTLAELQKVLGVLEKGCDSRGIDIEFE